MSTLTYIHVLYVYSGIALLLFLVAISCALSKKDVLGNGMKLGLGNSLIISLLWPMTLVAILCGICLAIWDEFKHL